MLLESIITLQGIKCVKNVVGFSIVKIGRKISNDNPVSSNELVTKDLVWSPIKVCQLRITAISVVFAYDNIRIPFKTLTT